MALALIDWVLIAGFLVLSFGIALAYSSRASKNMGEYFLGGRNMHWIVAGTSMVATTFAADTPLAVTELVVKGGISNNWLWWNMLIGGMLTTFFFARLWRRANIMTEVEFIGLRYGGKAGNFLRGFKSVYLGLFLNVIIMGWVNIAMVKILEVFFNLENMFFESERANALLITSGAMLFTALYSSISGLMGVAITDVVQFVIAMTGCIVLAVVVVNSEKIGGISGLKEKLGENNAVFSFFPSFSGGNGVEIEKTDTIAYVLSLAKGFSITIGAGLAFIGFQWWASWYPGAEPGGGGYVAQRMMSTKNEKHAVLSTLLFQMAHYCLRPWPWILVGLSVLVLYPQLTIENAGTGYVMAMNEFLPPGLKGLLLVAFLAAYMSTISTQLNWGASYLVNDLYIPFIKQTDKENKEGKDLVWAGRIVTLILMVFAACITPFITSISAVWEFLIQCGAGLGLVLILRWFWWRINVWSEITATIVPFLAYGFTKSPICPAFLSGDPNSYFFTIGITTFAWLFVTMMTKPESDELLDSFYKRIRPGGSWGPSRERTGITRTGKGYGYLFGCWFSAVIFVYSFLFFSGKIILQYYNEAWPWLGGLLVSGIMLALFMRKAKIFEED